MDSNDPNLHRANAPGTRLEQEQPDPMLGTGRRTTLYAWVIAVAIALILGIVFYGLNNTETETAGTAPPTPVNTPGPSTTGSPGGTPSQPGPQGQAAPAGQPQSNPAATPAASDNQGDSTRSGTDQGR